MAFGAVLQTNLMNHFIHFLLTSAGLSFVPRADTPVYNATKAAVRSFTISLRHQLQNTSVRVIELIPPAVQSELHDFLGSGGREVSHLSDIYV